MTITATEQPTTEKTTTAASNQSANTIAPPAAETNKDDRSWVNVLGPRKSLNRTKSHKQKKPSPVKIDASLLARAEDIAKKLFSNDETFMKRTGILHVPWNTW